MVTKCTKNINYGIGRYNKEPFFVHYFVYKTVNSLSLYVCTNVQTIVGWITSVKPNSEKGPCISMFTDFVRSTVCIGRDRVSSIFLCMNAILWSGDSTWQSSFKRRDTRGVQLVCKTWYFFSFLCSVNSCQLNDNSRSVNMYIFLL